MKKTIYKLLELVYPKGVRTLVSGIEIRLPFRYHRYYESDYESDHTRFFRQHISPGHTVLDIGAQLGLMSKLFSDLTGPEGRVYAFEPTPYTFRVLTTVLRINGISSVVKPVQQAVSDKKGTALFHVSDTEIDAANSLSDVARGRSVSAIRVELTSVDEFVAEEGLEQVDFIKIDAEGAEYYVLLGARETMQKHRPVIHLALHPLALHHFNSSLKEIFNFIQSQNYEVRYRSIAIGESDFTNRERLFDVQLLPLADGPHT
jgi:FkbM family methyltransferase